MGGDGPSHDRVRRRCPGRVGDGCRRRAGDLGLSDGLLDDGTVIDGLADGLADGLVDGLADGLTDGTQGTDVAGDLGDVAPGSDVLPDVDVDDAGTDAADPDATVDVADTGSTDATDDTDDANAPDQTGDTADTGISPGGWSMKCFACHGDATRDDPAPPVDTSGLAETWYPTVGAHTIHLSKADWHKTVVCTECHAVPSKVKDPAVPTHLNLKNDLIWGPVAKQGSYDVTENTCSATYCHGGTLQPDLIGQATQRKPLWTNLDGTQDACGSACHTNPPGGNHPKKGKCESCHAETLTSYDAATATAVWKDSNLHVDGKVQVQGNLSCTSCHGDEPSNDPAPPVGTKGETKTTQIAVGAHTQHLQGSSWHRPGDCADCHIQPDVMLHATGAVELLWGAVATAGSAKPAWDVGSATCGSTWCHGGKLAGPKPGGSVVPAPKWTQVDGSQSACGSSCHTNPPGGGHPQGSLCANCHGQVIATFDPVNNKATWKNAALHVDGKVQATGNDCTSCHGDPDTKDPMPPKSTQGETATTAPGVGAHAQHIQGGDWHRAGQCADCHKLPTDLGHADGLVDFAWGAVALAQGAKPAFDDAKLTCSGSHCHGSTLQPAKAGGKSLREPVWNKVDGSQVACGSTCHTNPPGGTHPPSTACATCHGSVISAYDATTGKATWKDATLHVDGKTQTATLDCTGCHGDPATKNPAPPKGTHGELDTTDRAVGAHANHLKSSPWHRAGVCTDCHVEPATPLHADGSVGMTWGDVPKKDGAVPTWDGAQVTCNSNYCHGATLQPAKTGGTVARKPVWTQVDGSQAKCGSTCHTNPPGGNHPNSSLCSHCHGAVISAYDLTTGQATWKNAGLHVDGVVQKTPSTCVTCHGDLASLSAAPPIGTKGETATTDRAVGAHAQHRGTATWHRDVQCKDCHPATSSMLHSNGKIELTWSSVVLADAAQPVWDVGATTCAGTYCHGSTLLGANAGGKVLRTPKWTQVDGTQDACGVTCHTLPPGGAHPQNTACATCHGATIASNDPATTPVKWADRTLHVDGKVDVGGLTCTSCHGDKATNDPAPPLGTNGETVTTSIAVGAHQQHLGGSDAHRAGECSDCHVVPDSTTHTNGKIDLAWSALAKTDQQTPAWDVNQATCASTYCHGNSLGSAKVGGTLLRTPKWTQVDGTQNKCGATCHTNPPGGAHPKSTACATCHSATIAAYDATAAKATWKDPELHVNGQVDVSALACTTCHGDAATNDPAPPKGTLGESATTAKAVGAHQQHLGASDSHRAGECTDCHTVPTSQTHTDGKVDLAFGTLAKTDLQTPAWDGTQATCGTTYCHGSSLGPAKVGGATLRTPKWTQVDGSQNQCGSTCHTNPPGGTHPQSTACQSCHGASIASYDAATSKATWTAASLHVNGKTEVTALVCTTCHGDAGTNNPAPPKGTKGETSVAAKAVGTHQQHLTASAWHRDGKCDDCHTVPTSQTHTDGKVDLAFGAVAKAGNATPAWDTSAVTCSGTWCHGEKLDGPKAGGTVLRTPKWTTGDGSQDACGATCHTNPPGGAHPQSNACQQCHAGVVSSYDPVTKATQWANADLHIDGKVDVIGMSCTACHGDDATNNPAPPKGTKGETQTSQLAVGAHAQHLATSDWHASGKCTDCHQVPVDMGHTDGTVDMAFAGNAVADLAKPAWDKSNAKCSGTYCHGSTLQPAAAGGVTQRTPLWTKVDGTQNACGSTCHTNPPGGSHPASPNCAQCHADVIASYVGGASPKATWKDPNLHIDGKVEVKAMTCTACHGDTLTDNPAPPLGTKGETATTTSAVGAHGQHLGASTWHRAGECTDCHTVPAAMDHQNGTRDLTWGGTAAVNGAKPSYSGANLTCSGTYCHGNTLYGPKPGGAIARTPQWTKVDGTQDACGATCHTLPPATPHPQNENCAQCHGAVVKSITPGNPASVVWNNPALHIDGKIDMPNVTCVSCHGNAVTNSPAPPVGSKGEKLTTNKAVGAHAQHLAAGTTWHRDGQCVDCHTVPASNSHANGKSDMNWSTPSNAGGLTPTYTAADATCANNWCHGGALGPAKTGGTVVRTPSWTKVDGTQDACGSTCHTNPPGGSHVVHTDCTICHTAVVAAFNPVDNATTWFDRKLHVNGKTEANDYHDQTGWTSPKFGTQHHGSNWFMRNQQRDEHNAACTKCHGADLLGGTVGVSCSNSSCHGGDWKSCDFCHGTKGVSQAPPIGVANETATNTLGVGRHKAHLTATASHVAFACTNCHTVPPAGNIDHAMQYAYSADLTTAGHHGDVAFSGGATGMTFNVNATTGNPASARGTCIGSCHSNGRGGNPVVTPYWAGGNWTVGSCGNCHAAAPNTGRHGDHDQEIGCTGCHPAASSSSHMNGTRDVLAVISGGTGGGSITTKPPGTTTQCTTRWACAGTCHGDNHNNVCW